MGKRGQRRYFKAADKVAIVKRHLAIREEVSAFCERSGSVAISLRQISYLRKVY